MDWYEPDVEWQATPPTLEHEWEIWWVVAPNETKIAPYTFSQAPVATPLNRALTRMLELWWGEGWKCARANLEEVSHDR